MTDLIIEARRRIAQLEAELAELNQFVAVADRLANGRPGPVDAHSTAFVRMTAPPSSKTYKGSSTKEIVAGLFEVLSEGGKTLERDKLIEELAARGITVPGMYPNKNLATILWRNQPLFEHVQGEGYRWTGVSLEEGIRMAKSKH